MNYITQKITNWIASWRQFPIAVWGFDIRRWENSGYEYWFNDFIKKFIFMRSMSDKGPTHLQYHSPFGFLIQWPLCFHAWYQFKPQQVDAEGTKIPGSEIVFYWRIGIARWDSGNDKYYVDKIGLFTWYGPGLRWD